MGEEFSFFFGDKLCDNERHRVLITRDKHKLTINLDNEPTKTVNIQMAKRFEAHKKLRINIRIYVGGTWKKTNERKTPLTKNFVGCLANVLFNAYNLISDAKKKNQGFTIEGGNVSFTCAAKDYKPIGFLNEYAYLTFASPDRNIVSAEFQFRTYDQNGLLMYRDGPKISVWLYLQKGKLKFEFYIPQKKQLVTLSTDTWLHDANFNDGEWHSVKASLDPAVMTFRVDDGRETTADAHAVLLGKQAKKLDFDNITYVGGGTYYKEMYGFVGCMKDLNVSGAKIDVVNLPKVRLKLKSQDCLR